MKWYVKIVISLLNFGFDKLWNFVDKNDDGTISKEELEDFIYFARNRLTIMKAKMK